MKTPKDAQDHLSGLVPVTRREALALMGTGATIAGLEACTRQPTEKIVPYVRAPEEIVPGKPLYYASSILVNGYAEGVLVESHMGRPTKIEGNKEHPASHGGTSIFAQAAVRTLYDPDRSQTVMSGGRISTFEALVEELIPLLAEQKTAKGAGLRIVSSTVTSPSFGRLLRALLADLPEARWYVHEPCGRTNAHLGAEQAFGRPVGTHYLFDRADVVLSLGSDALVSGPGAVRYARDFAKRRRIRKNDLTGKKSMNRLYALESTPTLTGAKADHRLAPSPHQIARLARVLATKLGLAGGASDELTEREEGWLTAVAADLDAHRGASIIIAGDHEAPVVHALAHALNFALGNVGKTVIHTKPVEEEGASTDLGELTRDMAAGKVELCVLLDTNPVYTAPIDLAFEDALSHVPKRVHHGLFEDETSAHCHWHVPATHELESWGDARAFDGTYGVVQPLIAPLYASKSALEVVSALLGHPRRTSYEIVREQFRAMHLGARDAAIEHAWQHALHDGQIKDTAFSQLTLPLPDASTMTVPPAPVPRVSTNIPTAGLAGSEPGPLGKRKAARKERLEAAEGAKPIEVVFRPDPTIGDGRHANNSWLQELPKPISKLTWENAIWISPSAAKELSVETGDRVELSTAVDSIRGPVIIVPGQASRVATVFLGYGRTRAGRFGSNAGFNGYELRSSIALDSIDSAQIRPLRKKRTLSITHGHHAMEGRSIARSGTIGDFTKHPDFAQAMEPEPPRSLSLYPEQDLTGQQWGMSVDLGACTGCNACTIACQAENNIAVVGRDQVIAEREMHWIRVDEYIVGDETDPDRIHMPVMCQHCENAPCELVCPVDATVHSPAGLNEMVYNRCIGTRYCSHNCPYKVRRFNFLHYQASLASSETLKLLMNPDVTVRSRGVMEKCSFCVQRINHARIEAKKLDRPILDGEIVTACEAACPSQAIVFGDINDPDSRVAHAKNEPLSYGLLADLNTRPRTTYLARLTNPNPALESPRPKNQDGHEGGHGG
jgi:molybdopterin-containing oxidoreductase family iron-sulfur binding subunit